jgi:hypothetical protein
MDLIRMLQDRRKAANAIVVAKEGAVLEPQKSRPIKEGKRTKAQKAKEHEPGTKDMRRFIIEEKPSAKVVREHLNAKIEMETASSDEED